ncbi:hypothetical protein O6H91_23G065700 [Diphasiastrum complanatum]|nr:hypothetical protein O6H91_23G065700 [Diphasiastrum complanatum]
MTIGLQRQNTGCFRLYYSCVIHLLAQAAAIFQAYSHDAPTLPRNQVTIEPSADQCNNSLADAYIALQQWKKAITNDPLRITATWVGPNVCNYGGVFCSPSPDNSSENVVSGIDLNHAHLAGTLPEEIALLNYLALFHVNSNDFEGFIPFSFRKLSLLFELDLSNNRFFGAFPVHLLDLPSVAYLDLRFNRFEGVLPASLFNKQTLDAIFLNDNRLVGAIPFNLGDSAVSVVNFANNLFDGSIPDTVGQMHKTLNEILFLNNSLSGCIPRQIGELTQLTIFDASFNRLGGTLPDTISAMISLIGLNIADNLLTGFIPAAICNLQSLRSINFSNNFFTGVSPECLRSLSIKVDESENCIPNGALQRSLQQCKDFLYQGLSCYPTPPLLSSIHLTNPTLSPPSPLFPLTTSTASSLTHN